MSIMRKVHKTLALTINVFLHFLQYQSNPVMMFDNMWTNFFALFNSSQRSFVKWHKSTFLGGDQSVWSTGQNKRCVQAEQLDHTGMWSRWKRAVSPPTVSSIYPLYRVTLCIKQESCRRFSDTDILDLEKGFGVLQLQVHIVTSHWSWEPAVALRPAYFESHYHRVG